jgi:hypothetical protein
VVRLRGHDPADTPAGVGTVAQVAWNDVQVNVAHGLARSVADVDADIVAVWGVPPVEDGLHLRKQLPEAPQLVPLEVEQPGDVTPTHDQGMTGAYREGVVERDG